MNVHFGGVISWARRMVGPVPPARTAPLPAGLVIRIADLGAVKQIQIALHTVPSGRELKERNCVVLEATLTARALLDEAVGPRAYKVDKRTNAVYGMSVADLMKFRALLERRGAAVRFPTDGEARVIVDAAGHYQNNRRLLNETADQLATIASGTRDAFSPFNGKIFAVPGYQISRSNSHSPVGLPVIGQFETVDNADHCVNYGNTEGRSKMIVVLVEK